MGRLWPFVFGTAYPLTRSAAQLVARVEPPGRPDGMPAGPALDVRPPDAPDEDGAVVSTVICGAHHLNGVPAGFGDGVHGGCQAMIHEMAARHAVGFGLSSSDTRRGSRGSGGGGGGGGGDGGDGDGEGERGGDGASSWSAAPPRLLSLEVTYLSSAKPAPLSCAVAPLRAGPSSGGGVGSGGGGGGLIRASSQLRPSDGSAADAPLSEARMTFRV